RRCGLACYIGIMIEKPTIGVAKKLLCGNQRSDSQIELDEKVLGRAIKSKNKSIFISVGNMISLNTAYNIIKNLILTSKWYPEPLYQADILSKKFRKKWS
ncbi:MAG: endonuclease V, partial [Nitrosopumilus sp.]